MSRLTLKMEMDSMKSHIHTKVNWNHLMKIGLFKWVIWSSPNINSPTEGNPGLLFFFKVKKWIIIINRKNPGQFKTNNICKELSPLEKKTHHNIAPAERDILTTGQRSLNAKNVKPLLKHQQILDHLLGNLLQSMLL